jgi:phosphoribosylformylglycinamidine (FGAM) synthase-like enzyme
VAETYRNLSAVGAKPLAITNCLNFANPQRPEIMAQVVEALRGMGEACRALDYPIVSGNVSLYNESKATGGGSAILPTPAIGGVGLLEDYAKSATIALKPDQDLVLIGDVSWPEQLGQSIWLRVIHGREDGLPPATDLAQERRHGELVRRLIQEGLVTAVHDVSDGGTLVALAEMALAGNCGLKLTWDRHDAEFWFGEHQSCYVVAGDFNEISEFKGDPEILIKPLARSGGDALDIFGSTIPLMALREASDSFFRDWMDSGGGLDASDLSGN